MSRALIEHMVALVQEGYTPQSVIESSFSLHPGSTAKVNKNTTATDPVSHASVSVSEGTVVTVIGVGGGTSGTDHHVQLPDGKKVVIPHRDLGEGLETREGNGLAESEGSEDSPVEVKVEMALPIGADLLAFLSEGYKATKLELPERPSAETGKHVVFEMKAPSQAALDEGLDVMRKAAGGSEFTITSIESNQ